ncbi:hypothetical protein P7C71_g3047, partial [Lecanoromycetidae sp. Uapishka_2]
MRGWEIENDMRKNLAIHYYDLVARCPENPPFPNTLRERATKYREASGSLAWDSRPDSEGIRDYIMSLLPPGAQTTRVLGGDLTKAQVAARKAINAGKNPNRRRKAKREAEARALEATQNADRMGAGGVTEQTTSRVSRRNLAFNANNDSHMSQHRNLHAVREIAGNTRQDAVNDGFVLTSEEQAEFQVQLEARRQYYRANPNASLRHPAVNPNNKLSGVPGTSHDAAVAATLNNYIHANDGIPQVYHNNSYQIQPQGRQRFRRHSEDAQDHDSESATEPRGRKRVRDEPLPVVEAGPSRGGVRDESLLGPSTSSGSEAPIAKRRRLSQAAPNGMISEEDDYLEYTPTPERSFGRKTTISDSEPEREAARRVVHSVSSQDQDPSGMASPELGTSWQDSVGQLDSSEVDDITYLGSQPVTHPSPAWSHQGNAGQSVPQASSFNMAVPPPLGHPSYTSEAGRSRAQNSNDMGHSTPNASRYRQWDSSAPAQGRSRNSSHAFVTPANDSPLYTSRPQRHQPRNSLEDREALYFGPLSPQKSPNSVPLGFVDHTLRTSPFTSANPLFSFSDPGSAQPLEFASPDPYSSPDSIDPSSSQFFDFTLPDPDLTFESVDLTNAHLFNPTLPDPNLLLDSFDSTNDDFLTASPWNQTPGSDPSNTSTSPPLTVSPSDTLITSPHQTNSAFQAEATIGLARRDARYYQPELIPNAPETILEALELTRLDYQQKLPGEYIPSELAYWGESYAFQHHCLQETFELFWWGPGPAPMLYCLPELRGGLESWRMAVCDEEGWRLLREVEEMGGSCRDGGYGGSVRMVDMEGRGLVELFGY